MVYYAHREQKALYRLGAHLVFVALKSAEDIIKLPNEKELLFPGIIAGFGHDFGKYTTYFQDYLLKEQTNPYKDHAFISAIWSAFLAGKEGLKDWDELMVFMSVLWHHRDLGNIEEYLISPLEMEDYYEKALDPNKARRLEIIEQQIKDLKKHAKAVSFSLNKARQWLIKMLSAKDLPVPSVLKQNWEELLNEFFHDWKDVYLSLYKKWRKFYREKTTKNQELNEYFKMVSLFSVLINNDKLHSGRVREVKPVDFPSNLVVIYKEKHFTPSGEPKIVNIREKVFEQAAERIRNAPLDHRFFTLTAPTGSGKTLAVINAAFILRERLKEIYGTAPKIIYALPFTSIIDQTYEVMHQIFSKTVDQFSSTPSPYLLKHHHLSEIFYQDREEEDMRAFDEAMLLIESWKSEVVVTTFVQLLHTLIGNRNRMLKKFSQLNRSILIMDEVQNIPVEYWPLVIKVLKEAAEYFDLRLILMTATRPEWFGPGEAIELAGEAQDIIGYFNELSRVRLKIEGGEKSIEDAVKIFVNNYKKDKSYLVISNTIRSSIEFYEKLTKLMPEADVYYLSTNIIPLQREERIKKIKEILRKGEKPIVISTQVVEAGVDLDFDEVWRDIGPIDSVIQAAGRCNRNFKHDKGTVKLIELINEKGEIMAPSVYGGVHIHCAKQVFSERREFDEKEFPVLVEQFFEMVREKKDQSKSMGLLEAMSYCRFTKAQNDTYGVNDFQLIKNRWDLVSIYVALDDKAEEVWDFYQREVIKASNRKARWEAFYKIKKDFGRYIISVPAKVLINKVDIGKTIPYLSRDLVDEFYDPNTGFKLKEEGAWIY